MGIEEKQAEKGIKVSGWAASLKTLRYKTLLDLLVVEILLWGSVKVTQIFG